MGDDRRGAFTLLEAIVALIAFVVLATLAARVYREVVVAEARIGRASDEAWAVRATRSVLARELSAGAAGLDWTPYPPDSVRLRAFRGLGLPCRADPDSTLTVRRDGGRRPDPAKDSVLVLHADGSWTAHDLTAVDSGACPEGLASPFGSVTERWRLGPPAEDAALVRVFESGSYHLMRALRYRRGGGGRQPLTAVAFERAGLTDSAATLRVRVVLASSGTEADVWLAETR